MRLLLLTASYSPVLGGLQNVTSYLAQTLLARDVDVCVVTNRYPRQLPKREIIHGVPVYRFHFLRSEIKHLANGRPDLFFAGLFYSPTVQYQLVKHFQSFRPDVVNIHFPDAQIPFLQRLAVRFNFRLVVSLHGDEVERWNSPNQSARKASQLENFRNLLQKADSVTACSHYLLDKAKAFEPAVKQKGKVIHNGVDLRRFANSEPFAHPRKYIFAYGRFTYKKGFDLLIEAFAKISSNYPDIDLLLAGSGEEEQTLQILNEKLRVQKQVRFLGRVKQEELVPLLSGSQFVVIPSRQEPFGLTVLEAMAAGKSVLATRVGGIPEFLPETENIFVEPTAKALEKGLRYAIKNLPIINVNNEICAKRLSVDSMVDKYSQILLPKSR